MSETMCPFCGKPNALHAYVDQIDDGPVTCVMRCASIAAAPGSLQCEKPAGHTGPHDAGDWLWKDPPKLPQPSDDAQREAFFAGFDAYHDNETPERAYTRWLAARVHPEKEP